MSLIPCYLEERYHISSLCHSFSHLYYPSFSESVAGDPGLDLELWLFIPFDSLRADCLFVSWIESSFKDRRISSVMGRGSFVGEGSLCRKKGYIPVAQDACLGDNVCIYPFIIFASNFIPTLWFLKIQVIKFRS